MPSRGERDEGRLHGILVTFNRPSDLRLMMRRLEDQVQPIARLVVVDNAPSSMSLDAVRSYRGTAEIDYVPAAENLGPAGGIALGMERMLDVANEADWIVLLDDDNPPDSDSVLSELLTFAREMASAEHRTGAVGLSGARFHPRQARAYRLLDEELDGPAPVDWIAGNRLPMYRVGAVKDVGVFRAGLFFGLDDLEYGLRMKEGGYSLYACGPLLRERRPTWARQRSKRPQRGIAIGLEAPGWRRYYSLRNLLFILRERGLRTAALRVALVRGIGKPLANLPFRPRLAVQNLKLNVMACRDAWRGTMGRTLDPDPEPKPSGSRRNPDAERSPSHASGDEGAELE